VQVQGGHNQDVAAALLRGLRAGSSQAWATLYDQLAPGIHRFAVSGLSGDVETAQDAVVETLADAARRISRFDPQKSSLSAWVYGIARRVVQTELRRRTRHKSVPAWAEVSFEDLAELSDSRDLGARTAARLDAQRRVREAADLLSEPELEMLSLSSINDLSVRDIGRVVGRSDQAVRVALHRARQKARRSAIEGVLLVGGVEPYGMTPHVKPYFRWLGGGDDWRTSDEVGLFPELSPASDEVVYWVYGANVCVPQPVPKEIWKASRDGSETVNLSEEAGLKGINDSPAWSPDGTMLAYVHWDPPEGDGSGPGEAWVMKADGSEARRIAPRESFPTWEVAWSPDGSSLICRTKKEAQAPTVASVNLWGREVRVLADAGSYATWSPDGTRIASVRRSRDCLERGPGSWKQLVVTKADGSAPKVLVEQFIADEELEAHPHIQVLREADPQTDWLGDLPSLVGPHRPVWSPEGDKIAFLAPLPFDAEGPYFKRQINVWIYDLALNRLTKITDSQQHKASVSWR
jgi:RNA polymerase sigma factor (sigma-70 family)